jgi:prepilin-type N-terminal cleavage/methylation domain-containing protein
LHEKSIDARLWVQTVINLLLEKLEEKNMKKLNKKKGFTLAELLVVVAIIAVLVAISIPIFTSQLGKAKKETNNANLRAAKGAAVSEYLSTAEDTTETVTYSYDITEGTIKTASTSGAAVTIGDNVASNALYKTITVEVSGTSVKLYASSN